MLNKSVASSVELALSFCRARSLVICIIAGMCIGSCADGSGFPALRDSMDGELQSRLMMELQTEFAPEKTEEAIRAKRVSVVVVDITRLEQPRVAAINPETMLYAASLPKIAILTAAFVEIDRGRLVLDDELLEQMTLMIRKSSNSAATSVLNRVGFERTAEILQSDRFRLYDPQYGGGLWVGRDYGGGETWKRDPINGISHGASAMQVARLYYLLLTGRLVSEESKQRMLEILSNPGIHHKFVEGLSDENPDAEIFRKSGSWKHFHADGGIVMDNQYQYIVVAIIEHAAGGEILERGIGAVDDTVEEANP